MPFLLMLQEASAAASGDPDPARPTVRPSARPPTRPRPPSVASSADGIDAVQMTPELWQRGSYLNHLKNEFSLEESGPCILRHALDPAAPGAGHEIEGDPAESFMRGPSADDDRSESLLTDQLPFLRTKLLDDTGRSNDFEHDDAQGWNHAAAPRQDAGQGIATGDDSGEIVLDSYALESLAVRTAASGLRQIGTYRMAQRQPPQEVKADEGSRRRRRHRDMSEASMFSVDLGDMTPPSLEGLAADLALKGLEESDDDKAAAFDRQMRSHFDSAFGDDLKAELQRAVQQFPDEEGQSADGGRNLDAIARNAVGVVAAGANADVDNVDDSAAKGARDGVDADIDAVLARALERGAVSPPSAPFEEEEWLFGETVKGEGDHPAAVADVHELSTELSRRRAPARPRRLTRAKRRQHRDRLRKVPSSGSAEQTRPGQRIRLPWESRHSSLLDSGWERSSAEKEPNDALDADTFDDDTVQVSSPEQRAAHRRARELFLGAVARYRAGDIRAAHADALLACVFDPHNPTYKTMTDRWAEELAESRQRAS